VNKERRLGRGLEALLGRPADGLSQATEQTPQTGEQIEMLSVYQVDANPFQPRAEFDDSDLESLSGSINDHGMLQPIVVRRAGERFQLISGERRLRAAIKAGWADVPARVQVAEDRQVHELAIVENLQRKDLSPLEKAASFQSYLESYKCTQEELASRLKIDRSTVANLIRLLELPEEVQSAIRSTSISQGHGRALLPLGDKQQQITFCRRIQRESLSVRATEEIVQEIIRNSDEPLHVIGSDGTKSQAKGRKSEQIAALEQEFRTALGMKVDLKQGTRGKGKLVLHFRSHDEFDRIHKILCDQSAAVSKNQVG